MSRSRRLPSRDSLRLEKQVLFECVSAEERIVGGGDTAGFELLATEFGILTHSWLCNGLERDCAKELGVTPNRRGFIPSYPEGQHCVEFISKDETRAAPGLWLPWLVIVLFLALISACARWLRSNDWLVRYVLRGLLDYSRPSRRRKACRLTRKTRRRSILEFFG